MEFEKKFETPEERMARVGLILEDLSRSRSRDGGSEGRAPDEADGDTPAAVRLGVTVLDSAAEQERKRRGRPSPPPPPVDRGHTKPLNRKTFRIVIPDLKDPQGCLQDFWDRYGNKGDRIEKHTSKVVTHASVRDWDLIMFVDYTVRGGHPTDLRKWIGRLVYRDPNDGDSVEVRLVETVRLQDNGRPIVSSPEPE